MASDDILRLTHCYEVGDRRMYWNQWYLEQGDVQFEPAPRLALRWEETILPLVADCWSNACTALYTTVNRVYPGPGIPGTKMSTWVGQIAFPSIPMVAGGILTFYGTLQGVPRRSALRLGGIAESLADNGLLVSTGLSLLRDLADRMLEHIPYTGTSAFGWYPGLYSAGRGWMDWEIGQVRRELGSQRTRRVRRGGRP